MWRPMSYHSYKRTALSLTGPDMSQQKWSQQVLLAKCLTKMSLFLGEKILLEGMIFCSFWVVFGGVFEG